MDIKIRKAQAEDLVKIQEMNLLLFQKEIREFDNTLKEEWVFSEKGKAYFSGAIESENDCVLVAEKDGKIIGYLAGGIIEKNNWRKLNKMVELENMFVLEEHRGEGAGTAMVKAFQDWCKEKGVERLRVTASFQNAKGINFYKKQGFKDYDLVLEMDL